MKRLKLKKIFVGAAFYGAYTILFRSSCMHLTKREIYKWFFIGRNRKKNSRRFFESGFVDMKDFLKTWGSHTLISEIMGLDYLGMKGDKIDYKKESDMVVRYGMQYMDEEKFNWDECSSLLAIYHPSYIFHEKFNLENAMWAIERHYPKLYEDIKKNGGKVDGLKYEDYFNF
ncbi:MAG: hypothetical protein ACK41G_11910 [Candidatus Thermochlorobacter sp.]